MPYRKLMCLLLLLVAAVAFSATPQLLMQTEGPVLVAEGPMPPPPPPPTEPKVPQTFAA